MLTARAKGLAERVVIAKHTLKNSAIPIVTLAGLETGPAPRRRRHHRDHLRLARAGAAHRAGPAQPRLPGGAGRRVRHLRHLHPDQPRRRPPLRLARSADAARERRRACRPGRRSGATASASSASSSPALARARRGRRAPPGAARSRCRATSRRASSRPGTPGHPLGHGPARPRSPRRACSTARASRSSSGSAACCSPRWWAGSLGLLAGYFGGWPGTVVMRVADVQLSFPFILLALTINAIVGLGLRNIIVSLSAAGWVVYARVVRGEVLSVKQREFVHAAPGARARAGAAPLPPRPAQRGAVHHHRGQPPVLAVHRGGGGHLVPGLRRAAADAGVGQHAVGEPRLPLRGVVARRLPGRRARAHRARHQPGRATGCATCSIRSSASEHARLQRGGMSADVAAFTRWPS